MAAAEQSLIFARTYSARRVYTGRLDFTVGRNVSGFSGVLLRCKPFPEPAVHHPTMNQQSTLRHSFTRICLCVPVAGMLASPAVAGDAQTASIRDGWGSAVAWGNNPYGQTTVPTDLGTVIQVAAGRDHTVALQSGGTVRAWGDNYNRQIDVPTDLVPVIQVAVGLLHTVALQSDGAVRAWGFNQYNQTTVPGNLGTVIQIAAGFYHTVAVESGGTVRAWGANFFGQTNVPGDLGTVTQVAAAGQFTVALQSGGTVRAWGQNDFGQTDVPTTLGTVIQVATGESHTVALQSDRTVRAWGSNEFGQTNIPTDLGTVIQVAAGYRHTIVLQSGGTVRAWGWNGAGQIDVPSNLGIVTQIGTGGDAHTVVISATAAELANHIIEQAPTEQVGITGITAAALFAQVTSLQSDLLVKTTALSNCETDKTGLQGDLLIKTTELSDCETDKAAALALGALRARGDLDDSGAVGQQDLQRILQHWGANGAADNSARLKDIHKSIRASLKEIRRMRR